MGRDKKLKVPNVLRGVLLGLATLLTAPIVIVIGIIQSIRSLFSNEDNE